MQKLQSAPTAAAAHTTQQHQPDATIKLDSHALAAVAFSEDSSDTASDSEMAAFGVGHERPSSSHAPSKPGPHPPAMHRRGPVLVKRGSSAASAVGMGAGPGSRQADVLTQTACTSTSLAREGTAAVAGSPVGSSRARAAQVTGRACWWPSQVGSAFAYSMLCVHECACLLVVHVHVHVLDWSACTGVHVC